MLGPTAFIKEIYQHVRIDPIYTVSISVTEFCEITPIDPMRKYDLYVIITSNGCISYILPTKY